MAAERFPRSEVGNAWLHADAVADLEMGDIRANGRDDAGRLVAENHRLLDDEIADPTVLVIMNVAAADADRLDCDPHLVVRRLRRPRNLYVTKTNIANALKDDGLYLHDFPPEELTYILCTTATAPNRSTAPADHARSASPPPSRPDKSLCKFLHSGESVGFHFGAERLFSLCRGSAIIAHSRPALWRSIERPLRRRGRRAAGRPSIFSVGSTAPHFAKLVRRTSSRASETPANRIS